MNNQNLHENFADENLRGTCPVHPHIKLVCPACIGARGGAADTEAKKFASRRNGRLYGGRPPKKKLAD